jgi:S-adenosylmethionine-diacylglycerol 3-amino-3-carboxypropyl transferase
MANAYFSTLNYTLANEDTRLELRLLEDIPARHVLTVAGSGGRVLPLLAAAPRLVTCVDLAQEQLWLTELRIESARALEHREFLAFWGYPPEAASADRRRELFSRIRLSPAAHEFSKRLFEAGQWSSVLYEGRWERTFAKLARVNRRLTGRRGAALFEARTLQEQRDYLRGRFPRLAWEAVLFILGNATVFNALLYRGSFPRKNLRTSSRRFYVDAFDRLLERGLARENFFLQLAFFGEIRFAEGNPVECDAGVFARAKAGLKEATIRYVLADAVHAARESPEPIDFLSFSDVPSYFSGDLEREFLQRIRPRIAPGGRVVVRNYLRVPEHADRTGYEQVASRYQQAIDEEKVQMYCVDVWQRSVSA